MKKLRLLVISVALWSASVPLAFGVEAPASEARKKGMNPDIGVNFLGLYRKSAQGNSASAEAPNGFSFQEAELQFSADVDPYVRAVGLFSIGEVEGSTPHDHEFALEPEELYLETLALPAWTLKVGKFKTAMGRHNTFHSHAFPFIDAPLVNQSLLGDEGLSDLGVSASYLLPFTWFMELTAQGVSAKSDSVFGSTDPNALAGILQLKNLWDLSESTTLEFQVFGTTGKNSAERNSHVLGSDLTVKWRPTSGGKYQSLAWTTEYLNGLRGSGDRLGGLASWLQYQFAERWWAQGRAEYRSEPTQKQSALLGFFPSEFSGYRLQLDRKTENGSPAEYALALQWNISIGAHPAHAY